MKLVLSHRRIVSFFGALVLSLLGFSALFNLRATSSAAGLSSYLAKKLPGMDKEAEIAVFVHAESKQLAIEAVRGSGMDLVDVFDRVKVAYAIGTKSEILRSSKFPGIDYVEGDRPIEFHLDSAHQATRGDEAKLGFTVGANSIPGADGSGVTIAIVDSGIDGTHPMFQRGGQSKVVRNLKLACFELPLGGIPCSGTHGNVRDHYFVNAPLNDSDTGSLGGHGTHVAGIAGGAATTSGGRMFSGAAPGAKLVGLSTGHFIVVYGAAAGLNWVLEHHKAPCGQPTSACPPIRVVNNSWGTGGEFDPNDIVSRLQDLLIAEGIVVVFSFGNGGGDGSTNEANPYAVNPTPGLIGVANYSDRNSGTRDGELSQSSSRGQKGRIETYPDVSAPGTQITSACRPWLAVCRGGIGDTNPDFGTISGTSMSAPMVSGIAAQLIQADPSLTPAQVEKILEDTAYQFQAGGSYRTDPTSEDKSISFDKGHGLVDAKAALARAFGSDAITPAPPAVQATPPECGPGDRVIRDGKGDTHNEVRSGSATLIPPYDPALDLTGGLLKFDSSSNTLTATIEVADLAGLSTQRTPLTWQFDFTYDGGLHYLEASRLASGDTEFVFGERSDVRIHYGEVTGAVNVSQDTISISVTSAQLKEAEVKELSPGDELTGLGLIARHGLYGMITTYGLSRDDAESHCRFIVGGGVAGPRPPKIGTPLSAANTSYEWSSEKFTRMAPLTIPLLQTSDRCQSAEDSKCDRVKVHVDLPASGATLKVTTTSPDEASDFDLYVYDPRGVEIGSSGSSSSDEEVQLRIKRSGVYTFAVNPYSAREASYSGKASIEIPAPKVPAQGTYAAALEPGGSYSWSGSGPLANMIFGCANTTPGLCDVRKLWVKAPASGADLSVGLTHTGNADLTDLIVDLIDPEGEVVAHSAGGTIHELKAYVPSSGVYEVSVTGIAPAGSYQATARLSCSGQACTAPLAQPTEAAKKSSKKPSGSKLPQKAAFSTPIASPESTIQPSFSSTSVSRAEEIHDQKTSSRPIRGAAVAILAITTAGAAARLTQRRLVKLQR